MTNNTAIPEQIQKMANSVKLAALVSLAINTYQLYGYLKEPTDLKGMMNIMLGIFGSLFIWLFGRELQAMRKAAALYWIALLVIGIVRISISGDEFTLNVPAIVLIVLWAAMTGQLIVWTRNKALA